MKTTTLFGCANSTVARFRLFSMVPTAMAKSRRNSISRVDKFSLRESAEEAVYIHKREAEMADLTAKQKKKQEKGKSQEKHGRLADDSS